VNILLLTQFYWPEVRSAPTNLAAMAEDLQRRGHEVTVITGFPNHPFGKIYDGYHQRWRQWDDVRGVKVLRVPLYADHSLSSARRLLHYASFALSSSTIGAWTTRRTDVDAILVYLPPWTNWLPIRVLELQHGAPLVYLVTDFWPEAFASIGRTLKRWQVRALERLVTAVIERASAICVNSPGFRRMLVDRGVPEERVRIVYDFVDGEHFFPSEPDRELAREHGMSGKFNVLYGGNLGAAQGLETVIEAAARLQDLSDLQFVFVGDGTNAGQLERLVAERELGNVRFIERQPMSEIHRFFAVADALLVHLVPSPFYRRQIPSKIIAYLACGRPILCAVAGSAADTVEEAGAGVCCAPGDPESMVLAVRELYAMPAAERARLGDNGRRAFLHKYTRATQVERVEALLERVVAEARP
jgi:glycosyltransferase involved in cell wall biosynthesis